LCFGTCRRYKLKEGYLAFWGMRLSEMKTVLKTNICTGWLRGTPAFSLAIFNCQEAVLASPGNITPPPLDD
jgi:hypothetical protein